jgi:hypothetical protein
MLDNHGLVSQEGQNQRRNRGSSKMNNVRIADKAPKLGTSRLPHYTERKAAIVERTCWVLGYESNHKR